MNETKRERLLSRARKQSGTLGEEIPDELTVQGTTIDLREFVFECKRLDAIPEDERERIEEVKLELKRERLARLQRIEDGEVTEEEAEELVRSVWGIDRAINALEGLDEPSIEEQLRRKRIVDAQELLDLMDMTVD